VQLYSYHSSSASYRVRIALALKGIAYEYVAVPLLGKAAQNRAPAYAALNPQRLVPLLVDGDVRIAQSLAILDYLEETHPAPPLLPTDPAGRARVRSLALHVACEIQPLNNLRVRARLAGALGASREAVTAWQLHWMHEGLQALEAMLAAAPARFCHGDAPTLADCCLVPQLFNARAIAADLAPYPHLCRVDAACLELPAFQAALPERQPDAPPGGLA